MAASAPHQPIEKATGWKIPGALTKHVLLDPGIAYTTADVLLFAGTNPVGLVAMLTATGVAASLKTAAVLQPKFISRYPLVKKLMQDDRTPLRAGGLALLVVAGAAVATGAWLPAAAAALFAVANIRLAESISTRHRPDVKKDDKDRKLTFGKIAGLFIKRPELYLSAGFACAGLMAGGAALVMLPIVAISFGIGMRNAIKGLPEHNGHPKLVTASAAGMFTAIGHGNGHGLIAAAHFLNTIVLAEMERRVTPGGAKQIFKNIGGALARVIKAPFKGLVRKPAPPPETAAPPVVTLEAVTAAPKRQEQPKVVFNQQAPAIIARSDEAVEIGKEAAKKTANPQKDRPAPTEEEKLHDVEAPAVKREEIDRLDLQKAFGVKGKVQQAANQNKDAEAEAINLPGDTPRRPKKPNAPAA